LVIGCTVTNEQKSRDIVDAFGNNTSQGSTLEVQKDTSLESGCIYEFASG